MIESLLALMGPMLAGSGAATAATAGSSAIPSLLGGSFLSSVLPSILQNSAGAAAPAAAGAVPLSGMMASPIPGSAIQEALKLAQAGGLSQGPGMAAPAGAMAAPQAANVPMAPTPNQIPPVPAPSGWQQALSNTATVQDMMLKQQGASRPPNAPSPNFYIPQGNRAPNLGTPLARGPSPLERFSLMLRRM